MPIRPEGKSTGKPSAPTAGPTIQLATGESLELSLGRSVRSAPRLTQRPSSQRRAVQHVKPSVSVFPVMFVRSVWNMP